MKRYLSNTVRHHLIALSLLLAPPGWAAERQLLTGHVPAAVAQLQPVGRVPASSRLSLAISLPLRHQAALTALLEELYDPASPQYRHYLTPEQFAERFGPTRQDYEAVIQFAKAHGLAVTATHPNRTLLDVSGTVEDIEKVLQVTLRVYQHPTEDRTFHTPDVEPSLDLAVPVLHIGGLEDLNLPRPLGHWKALDAKTKPTALGGSAPGGGFLGNDFRAAYVPGVSLTGAGQVVALYERDGFYASDITNYERLAGLPNVPLETVLVDGYDGTPGAGNGEIALDVQMAISMAPGLAKVLIYEASLGNAGADVDLLNRMATDNAAKQISCSWTMLFDATKDQIFQQYAAQGQSFFKASGDEESSGGVADDPYITVVGGTELNASGPGGAWVSEKVWNLGYAYGGNEYIGSGGGVSSSYPIPSWQRGLSMTANHGSTVWRNSPDVAMVAENIWSFFNNGDGAADTIGGTSAAAPLWAGFVALANQLAAANGRPPVGFINPAIYALGKSASYPSLFHDITVGNNISLASPNNYFAVPGYDLCTGWGTPAGSNLLYALALPQLFQLSPATNLTVSGPVGGPFSPSAQNYSLSNLGATALDWTLAYTVPWLDASATSGTLAAGGPGTNVTLALNAAASSLPAGSHPATVWFTNLNDGSVQSRLITLAVVTPPVITSGPADQAVPEGGTATFTVVPAANALLTYAWAHDGTALTDNGRISGSRASTLTISNVAAGDIGTYTVLVTNVTGSVSATGTLATVSSPPVIIVPPTDQTVLAGAAATFTVKAAGSQPLFYQWRSHGANIPSGATSSVLTLSNVSPADADTYSVVVSNNLGWLTNVGASLTVISVALPEVALTTLYSFTGGSGAAPNGLVQATNGNFYGTANAGGSYGYGTVFRITTNGTLTTLRHFTGGSDGATPKAALLQATDGQLYGTTSDRGANYGGTVFRMTLTGGFTTVHTFADNTFGPNSFARLLQASDGYLYGTTSADGSSNFGTVFKLATNGTFTLLHSFTRADGARPRVGLVQGDDGDLYGTTQSGGANPYDGTVFGITTNGALTTLFQFDAANSNSFSPRAGLLKDKGGNFYGTTARGGIHGCGTVFKITPAGLLTTLHAFDGVGDGQLPLATLVEGQDTYFYGTTVWGGPYNDGTIFRLSPNGQLTTLLYFDGYNGANPAGALVQAADGSFYGTTLNGGAKGFGTVFRLTVPKVSLSIALSGGQIVLSWPSWASDLALQQKLDLNPGPWLPVTNAPVLVDQQYQLTLPPPAGGNIFYRLVH